MQRIKYFIFWLAFLLAVLPQAGGQMLIVNGWKYSQTSNPGFDTDAQAFLTAAGISSVPQQVAVDNLVKGLKAEGLWGKVVAAYPMVGGTAASHAVNLKTPGTYNLSFVNSPTHSSSGVDWNGTNQYATTGILGTAGKPTVSVTYYTPEAGNLVDRTEFGFFNAHSFYLQLRGHAAGATVVFSNGSQADKLTYNSGRSPGLYTATLDGTAITFFGNGVEQTATSTGSTGGFVPAYEVYLGARNNAGTADMFSDRAASFVAISDGLTSAETVVLKNLIEAYQDALGRGVIVSDADAQLFVEAAGITEEAQRNAVNSLVVALKAEGLWGKMVAIYPMVGGTATAHAVNLKSPGTFNLTFGGTPVHNSTGVDFNSASSSYANTGIHPAQHLPGNTVHASYYSRQSTSGADILIAATDGSRGFHLLGARGATQQTGGSFFGYGDPGAWIKTDAAISGVGLQLLSKIENDINFYVNGAVTPGGTTSNPGGAKVDLPLYIGGRNSSGNVNSSTNRDCSFATIGEGLSYSEQAALAAIVESFQATLGRSVLFGDDDANNFIAAAGITAPTQQTAVLNLITGLKSFGLWDKFDIFYPMVGGNATAHAVNLRTPGTYNLAFSGSPVHDAGGVKWNGTSTYANTGYAVTSLTQGSASLVYYVTQAPVNDGRAQIGASNGSDNIRLRISNSFVQSIFSNASSTDYWQYQATNYPTLTSLGLYVTTNSGEAASMYKDGVEVTTVQISGSAGAAYPTARTLYLGARNNSSTTDYADDKCALAAVAKVPLTAQEVANLSLLIETFQDALSRGVIN